MQIVLDEPCLVKERESGGDFVGQPGVVTVQQIDNVPGTPDKCSIQGRPLALILVKHGLNDGILAGQGFYASTRTVRGAVVHDDDFLRLHGLGHHGFDSLVDESFVIVIRHKH
ncbi:MAG: hypothetical protein L6357_09720 [Pseudodesulfovibrio aespoeensis]|nr:MULTISPECIES: hypothetical protein [Pseudodesulfovibrio]MCG2733348.1 hypothetical protein [Pseudodesulfovibrio aespoeensis]